MMSALVSEKKPSILVMMATYNGEKYVAAQIESILAQSDVDVHLLISDDCSTDSTYYICQSLERRYGNVAVRRNERNKRVARNFIDMLYGVDAFEYDYFAFSDQDDYWMPNKLHAAISKMEKAGDGPRLYYSDVTNVDETLEGGKREYYPFARFCESLELLLTVNWASGCTMVFNSLFAKELQKYRPVTWPRLHDGWAHLVALSCGWVVPDLENSYLLRRLSGNNQVGDRGFGSFRIDRFRASFSELLKTGFSHYSVVTAGYLYDGYADCMGDKNKAILLSYLKRLRTFRGRFNLAFDAGYRGPYEIENRLYSIKMLLNYY